jgi:hypothetical protein
VHVIIFKHVTHHDIEVGVNFVEILHSMSVLLYEPHRRCNRSHKLYMDWSRDGMSDIDDQRFDQLQVNGAQLMELVEVFFDSDLCRSSATDAAIHQEMNRAIIRPWLEVMLPDVMMLLLFISA